MVLEFTSGGRASRGAAVIASLAVLVLSGCTLPAGQGSAGHEDGRTAAVPAPADVFDVSAHYSKSEFMVPMRDGVKLYTAVYAPRDTSKQYPILLYRTPYSVGSYGPDVFPPAGRVAPTKGFL